MPIRLLPKASFLTHDAACIARQGEKRRWSRIWP